jgi:arylsulfatase A-like enzyme
MLAKLIRQHGGADRVLRRDAGRDREPRSRTLERPVPSSRRALALVLLGTLGLAAACHGACGARPNILVLSLDTLRADHLSLYGYARATSPHLDALARESIVFEHALAQASATRASHNSLFQSRLPSQTGPETPTLAGILRANGYQTLGLTDGGMMSQTFGFARGFDRYEELGGGLAQSLPLLEAWLRDEARAPWYVFLHTYDIHLPYAPPPPYDTSFFPEYDGPITPERSLEVCRKIRHLYEYADFEGEVSLTPADREKMRALYDGGVLYTDRLVGRLVHLLEEQGRLDDTVLVVLSDHGEEFWEHGSVLHGHTVYQELLHVLLLARLPGARHGGRRVASTVRLLDVTPTLLELARLPVPESFQGQSLVGELEGQPGEERAVVSEMGPLKTRIEGPWKLILDTRKPQPLLFDLERDPEEHDDLAGRQPERVVALTRALRRSFPEELREVPVVPPGELPAELRERLRALGYVE